MRGTSSSTDAGTSECSCSRGLRPERRDGDRAGTQRARRDGEPDLRGAERHRRRRTHCDAGDLPGRGVDPRRHVDRDDGPVRGIDQLDHPRRVLARRPVEADPEQRVDHDIWIAQVADAVDDRHLAARLTQHPRADPAVTAVLPLAADDRDPAGEAAQHQLGDRSARALHQIVEGAPVCLLGAACLLGGEERQEPHRSTTTATAAASSRECVIDSSIEPAPTFSAHAAVRPVRWTPGFGRPRISISFHVK